MAIQGFDKTFYLNAKLEQLQNDPQTAADWAGKDADFLEARLQNGFGLTAEQHYEQYGFQEGLAPNAFFNPDEYIRAKATAMFNDPATAYLTVDAAAEDFVSTWNEIGSGNVYEHYLQYGEDEGVNPSNDFDVSAYYEAKLAQLQADGNTEITTVEGVKAAFEAAGLTALEHFLAFGQEEGIAAPAVPADEQVEVDNSVAGQTFTLTTGVDSETGTAGDDTFTAGLKLQDPADASTIAQTLQSFDEIKGGEGTDRLNATLVDGASGNGSDNGADGVLIEDVEQLYLRSREDTTLDLSNVTGAEQVWNDRSTNDLALTNVQNGVTVGLNDVKDGEFSVSYAASALGSATATQNIVANGAGDRNTNVGVNVITTGSDSVTNLNIATSSNNFIGLRGNLNSVETLNVSGTGSLNLAGTAPSSLEAVAAGDYEGDLSFAATSNTNLQEVTTGSGNDSITLGGNLEKDGFVVTGEGNDTVDADDNNVDADARIELGAGDDAVTNLGTVDKDAVIDGGAGTDTLQLQAVASANVGAFQNFEVFDVAALDKTLDMDILNDENDVQEIVGSGATGAAAELVNLGDGVGFRATADMTAAQDIVLTQKNAGALDVTLDADQAATAGASADNDATTDVNATNATSVNVAFDSESVNEIAGSISNTQTITLETGAAASINVVSGGENAANVLDLSDASANDANDSGLLENIVITGDQDLTLEDIDFSSNGGTASVIESIDASDLAGALTASLTNLANGGTLELGSGADRITVDNSSTVNDATGTDVETIVGFEKSTSTTDADMIDDADQLVFGTGASVAGDTTGTDSGTGVEYEIVDGVLSFNGAGASTLEEAFKVANAAVTTADEAVVFEYTGDTYAFIEADGSANTADDTLVKLAGVTDVDSLNADSGNLYIA